MALSKLHAAERMSRHNRYPFCSSESSHVIPAGTFFSWINGDVVSPEGICPKCLARAARANGGEPFHFVLAG